MWNRKLIRNVTLAMLSATMLPFFPANAQTATGVSQQSASANELLVPQNLLGLVHAPEVHDELKMTAKQVRQLEQLFAELDGNWFRARILPAEKRYPLIASFENHVRTWFTKNCTPEQAERLQQLEYRAQGVRMLLRSDLARDLKLEPTQIEQFAQLARSSDEAAAKLQKATMSNAATEELKTAAAKAAQDELDAVQKVLTQEQQALLVKKIGEAFDTVSLQRIYPMAPEIVSVSNWINSKPLTLQSLRGKVVLVHFYAFQCHNCHANFEHYKRWHKKYGDDVVVIGIQTPETSAESDPNQVRAAAKEKGFQFPVAIDLESKNWKEWSNTMWPTVYVVDKNGYLRHWWQGELNWRGATGDKTIEDLVAKLLKE